MNNNFRYVITLPSSSEILKVHARQILGNYSLENLQLEYETVDNQDIVNQISNLYSLGRSLSSEHLTLMKTVVWSSSSTLINENINIPRISMSGIVMLFRSTSVTVSEVFVYPNISEIKVTIEEVSNSV